VKLLVSVRGVGVGPVEQGDLGSVYLRRVDDSVNVVPGFGNGENPLDECLPARIGTKPIEMMCGCPFRPTPRRRPLSQCTILSAQFLIDTRWTAAMGIFPSRLVPLSSCERDHADSGFQQEDSSAISRAEVPWRAGVVD
jgi:hypothetical protein